MDEPKRQMVQALKSILVPRVRALGFSGTFPHFRRHQYAQHHMLMLMFNKYGGSFYIEAGRMTDAECLEVQARWASNGKPLALSDLTVGHCKWNQRIRLGGTAISNPSDHWFVFGPDKYGKVEHKTEFGSDYEAIASRAVESLEAHAENFFANAL